MFSPRRTSYALYLRIFVPGCLGLVTIGAALDAATWRVRAPAASSALLWLWILVVVGTFTAARFKRTTSFGRPGLLLAADA